MNRTQSVLVAIGLLALLLTGCMTTPNKKVSPDEVASVNVQLGVHYFQQKEYAVALERLKTAIDAKPDSASAHAVIALVYDALDDSQALIQYQTAIDLTPGDSPDFGDIHNNYGAYLCKKGKLEKAEAEFLLAIKNKLYRTPASAYENLALCALKKPDEAKAVEFFRKALEIAPTMPRSLFQMADIKLRRKEYLAARAYIERFHAANEATATSLWLGIRIERNLGDRKAVFSYAQILHDKYPDSLENRQYLATRAPKESANVADERK